MSRLVEISFFMFRRNATETITVIFFLFTASMLLSFDTKKKNKTKKNRIYGQLVYQQIRLKQMQFTNKKSSLNEQ